jgi:hypothetical protein
MRPFGSSFNVSRAADPVLDAWRGASSWAAQPENRYRYFFWSVLTSSASFILELEFVHSSLAAGHQVLCYLLSR